MPVSDRPQTAVLMLHCCHDTAGTGSWNVHKPSLKPVSDRSQTVVSMLQAGLDTGNCHVRIPALKPVTDKSQTVVSMLQARHDTAAKDRQAEAERANASDVAHAAKEVQLVTEQQRVAQLTANLQEAGANAEVPIQQSISLHLCLESIYSGAHAV